MKLKKLPLTLLILGLAFLAVHYSNIWCAAGAFIAFLSWGDE